MYMNAFDNVKLKINCAKVMKVYLSSEKTIKKENFCNSNEVLIQNSNLQTPKAYIPPLILQDQIQSQSGGQQSQTCSMRHLCDHFLQKIASLNQCKFETNDIIQETKVQKRRVYDLINILEGCGNVQRISKGTYIWNKFVQYSDFLQKYNKRKGSTSLSSTASHIKKLLIQSQKFNDFKDICSLLFQHINNKSLNLDSIKRRAYECCKVFRFVGFAEKMRQSFRWNPRQIFQKIAYKQGKRVETKTKSRTKITITQKTENIILTNQKKQFSTLIPLVLSKISTEENFKLFLKQLSTEFYKKNGQNKEIERELKYQ